MWNVRNLVAIDCAQIVFIFACSYLCAHKKSPKSGSVVTIDARKSSIFCENSYIVRNIVVATISSPPSLGYIGMFPSDRSNWWQQRKQSGLSSERDEEPCFWIYIFSRRQRNICFMPSITSAPGIPPRVKVSRYLNLCLEISEHGKIEK